MERQNTEPIFNSEEFTEYMNCSSFNEKLDNTDIVDILDPTEENINVLNVCTEIPVRSYKQEFPLWYGIDEDCATNNEETFFVDSIDNEATSGIMPTALLQDDSNSSFENQGMDESDRIPSLGFESWPGHLNFSINFKSAPFINSKQGCYSCDLNKLYIMRTASVPIEFSVDTWKDATINITPVFLKSQNISEAVVRCHNHRIADEARAMPNPMHIIEVVNSEATHKMIGERYTVEVPLGRPAPGEDSRIIYIKSGCWNTCVGPSRRNYCIIFTLFDRSGREIGRQVVNFKSCQSPLRDMGIDMRKHGKAAQAKRKCRASPKQISKKTKIENVPSKDTKEFETLVVLAEIAPDVKKYINCIMAERFARKDKHFIPPYADD